MSARPASPLGRADAPVQRPADGEVHRRRDAPDEHLCTCGRPREHCVRETVRALWQGGP